MQETKSLCVQTPMPVCLLACLLAVLGCGHAGGVVTMWTPNITTPVVRMLCHRGPVTAVAFDPLGHYMVTAGGGGRRGRALAVQVYGTFEGSFRVSGIPKSLHGHCRWGGAVARVLANAMHTSRGNTWLAL